MIMSAMVQDDSKHRLIVPNALHHYSVDMGDLPLSCPMPGMYAVEFASQGLSGDRSHGMGQVFVLRS